MKPVGGALTLGIETSCDDTSIVVLAGESDLLANVVSSQLVHGAYGGVVPDALTDVFDRVHVPDALGALGRVPEQLVRVHKQVSGVIGNVHVPDRVAGVSTRS